MRNTSPITCHIGHLYPADMNLYGDRGNVLALAQRCRWRGIDVTVSAIEAGDQFEPDTYDILFMGGGQDTQQHRIEEDFLNVKGPILKKSAELGVVILGVCGGYQLLGHYFDPIDGKRIEGLGLLDVTTTGSTKRLIGNVTVKRPNGDLLVGFENHSGQTKLGNLATPIGTIIKGNGNNAHDNHEGAIQGTVYGTYLHGSLLPKNPAFADELLLKALQRRYPELAELSPLDNRIEELAHQQAAQRPA